MTARHPRREAVTQRGRKVQNLSKEAISRVREAETQAAAIREKAARDAETRMETCEKRSAQEAVARINAADADLKARLAAVRDKADALIGQTREDACAEAAELKAAAAQRKQEAVKVIVWEMFDSCQ